MKHPAFAKYLKAIDRIPDLGNESFADKSFFLNAPKCFFDIYRKFFIKHTSTKMRTNEILVYLFGGNPKLAHIFIRWLFYAQDNLEIESHSFPSEKIKLRHHGITYDALPEVNTKDCMEWLTSHADIFVILDDP